MSQKDVVNSMGCLSVREDSRRDEPMGSAFSRNDPTSIREEVKRNETYHLELLREGLKASLSSLAFEQTGDLLAVSESESVHLTVTKLCYATFACARSDRSW